MDFLSWLSESFSKILNGLYNILPKSPFTWISSNPTVDTYIGYINYFFPVSTWIPILELWLLAIGSYYAFKVILKWIKLE